MQRSRVGALLRWPGEIEPGSSLHPMQAHDLYATLERAARLPRRAPRESIDRWQQIRHPQHHSRKMGHERIFVTNRPPGCVNCCCNLFAPFRRMSTVIDHQWKLVTSELVRWNAVPLPGSHTVELFGAHARGRVVPGFAIEVGGKLVTTGLPADLDTVGIKRIAGQIAGGGG